MQSISSGGGEAPRNLSGRLVAATWWLFGFIIIASYTANLAAFLTVSRLDSVVESLEELARQYKVKYAAIEGSTTEHYFKSMSEVEEKFYEIWKNMSLDDSLNETERAKLAVWDYPVSDKFTKIYWTMKETKPYKNMKEAITKTLESKSKEEGSNGWALLAEATQVRYAALMNCNLREVGSEFSRRPVAFPIAKNSPFREPISQALLKLANDRSIELLKEKWWKKNPYSPKCYHYNKRNDGIELDNIAGIFFVMAVGVAMALFSLIIEFGYFKYAGSRTRVITVKDYNQPLGGKRKETHSN